MKERRTKKKLFTFSLVTLYMCMSVTTDTKESRCVCVKTKTEISTINTPSFWTKKKNCLFIFFVKKKSSWQSLCFWLLFSFYAASHQNYGIKHSWFTCMQMRNSLLCVCFIFFFFIYFLKGNKCHNIHYFHFMRVCETIFRQKKKKKKKQQLISRWYMDRVTPNNKTIRKRLWSKFITVISITDEGFILVFTKQ